MSGLLNLCSLSYSRSRGPVHCRTPEVFPREEGTVAVGRADQDERVSACRWCMAQLLSRAPAPRLGFYALLSFQNLTVSLFACGFRKSVVNTKVKK